MNPADPLTNLRAIHLPDPISWWPPAPGWWILLIIAIAVVGYLIALLVKRHSRRLYRRQALVELKQVASLESAQQLVALLEILRRVAITAYPDQGLANLGTRDFLIRLKDTCRAPLFEYIPDDLEAMLYSKDNSNRQASEEFLKSARLWVQRHPDKIDREPSAC